MSLGTIQDDGYRYLQYNSRSLRLPKDPFEPVNLADMPAYEHGVIGFYEIKDQIDYHATTYTWSADGCDDELLGLCARCFGRIPPGDLFLCLPCVTWLRGDDDDDDDADDETHG